MKKNGFQTEPRVIRGSSKTIVRKPKGECPFDLD